MTKSSDLNVTLHALGHHESSSIFPSELSDNDLLSFLKITTELAADEVFWMRSDSEIFYVNNAACEKLGYPREKLLGMKVWEWDPLFPQDVWPTFWSELKAKQHVDFETQHQNQQGETFPVRIKGHFLHHDGEEFLIAFVSDISDIKSKETALKRQSEQLESLVDKRTAELEREKRKFEEFVNLAPIGIAITRFDDGSFQYINDEFARFTGHSIEELNRMDYWQLTPKKYEELEHKQIESMQKTGRYGPYEKEYIHRAGHCYPVRLSGIKIREQDGHEYIWSVVQDITQQKEFEIDIQKANERAQANAFRLKLANDSAGIGVWEWDISTNELVWDDWMYRLYGLDRNQFSGAYEAWESAVHPEDIDQAKHKLEEAITGLGVYDPEFRVVHPGGEIRFIKATAEVLRDDKGEAVKMIGVNYDITDQVNAIEHLALAKQEAENAARAKSDFLANMSHEIRTPMNGVVGMLQVLRGTQLTPQQHSQLDIAISSADSLLVLLNDILDFSKIEAGKLNIEAIEFNLAKQIEGVVSTVSHAIPDDSEVELILKTSGLEDLVVLGDPVRLRQVITNLVSNAIKFTGSGSITIEAGVIASNENTLSFQCKVSDTGIGIEPHQLDTLFDKFTQADSSTTRKFGGTGLGLSICKTLCELMNGNITASSEPGKGTSVTFELEFGIPKANTSNRDGKTELHNVSEAVKNFGEQKVLLVDDNMINQLVAEHMLQQMGVSVDKCVNGREAIEALANETYALVLMDCQMPEMDGFEATRRIREGEAGQRYKQIPIVAMTANAMQGDRELCLTAGMDDYIAKPVEEKLLRSTLAKWLAVP